MNILIASYVFHPVVGGISTSTALLAREFVKSGHEVRIVTFSKFDGEISSTAIVRTPNPLVLIREVAWADVVLSMHLSIRLAWPLLFLRRPWVVAHHSWLTQVNGMVGWLERLKRRLVRHATCISVSRAVANDVGSTSVVIGAPYDDELFRPNAAISRRGDLLFVGRLVSSKGGDVLIKALAALRKSGHSPALTIVGDGPEMQSLRRQVRTFDLEDQVSFAGQQTGNALRDFFCAHRIMVVPSITPETFGVVAVEAIACGCVVVGSDRAGGLPDAIGPCGVTFRMGDPEALAERIAGLLSEPERISENQKWAASHSAQFASAHVARQYLKVIQSAVAVPGVSTLFFLLCVLAHQAIPI
jgi:glycogen(starch) synthase